jgi:hypothetical protein
MTPPDSQEFRAEDFDATYQLRMITAYPVIAQMDADELMFGDPEEKREAFQRILNNRNLATTHRLYLEAS